MDDRMQINRYSGMGFRSTPLLRIAAKQGKVDGTILSDHKPAAGKMDKLEHSTQSNQVTETQAPEKIKNTSSLPDHLFEYIQKQAVEDAKKGVFESDEYVSNVLNTMRSHVSPNRSKLISMFNPMVMNAKYAGKPASYFSISGFPGFTARFSVGRVFGAYMSIWNEGGEQVLSYSPPPNAGWHEHQTKAETNFIDEAHSIYSEIYHEVRAQMKAEAAAGGSHLNVQV